MNPEVKAEWVAALRSGDYEQGKSWLRKAGVDSVQRYCCLGVLCDLSANKGEGEWIAGNRFLFAGDEEISSSSTHLPKNLAGALGLSNNTPYIGLSLWEIYSLTELNDDDDDALTFDQIADMIECFL